MKSFLYLSLLTITACGLKHTAIDYGKTTVSDLIAVKGRPVEENKIPVDDGKILIYEDNEKFQAKDNIITHGFKDPKGDERTVIFWKHKFRDCDVRLRKISEPKGHEFPEYEMKCPSLGQSVIYSEGSEFVSRIIEHEKQ
jgi:hypothetical protein